jgi:hypothetical protein
MRCKTSNGETWTTVRVREMRERLGIAEYDPAKAYDQMISLMKAAERLGICVGSAKSLVLNGGLPATQIMLGSPWMVPVEATRFRSGADRGAARDRSSAELLRAISIR